MAELFREPKKARDPRTGKRVDVLDEKGRAVLNEYWTVRFYDHTGKRKKRVLPTTKRAEAEKFAARLETREQSIKVGLVAKPTPAVEAATRPFSEIADEYIAWGRTQGGRRNNGWSKENLKKRMFYVKWMTSEFGLSRLGDLDGKLPRAEKALRGLAGKGRTGTTLGRYREALFAFCSWCVDREYLDKNPFRKMGKFDQSPVDIRRNMTDWEIGAVLGVAPYHRNVLYRTALSTGFRANELRSLDETSLDTANRCIHLSKDADKGRKARCQPVSEEIVALLVEYIASGDARRRYRDMFAKAGQPLSEDIPGKPLLYVPSQTGRSFMADLEKAGVDKTNADGYLDFHALRVAYINMILRTGVDAKTAQELARHSTVDLTLNTYGRADKAGLERAAAIIGGKVAGFICAIPDTADRPEPVRTEAKKNVTFVRKGVAAGRQGLQFHPPVPFFI